MKISVEIPESVLIAITDEANTRGYSPQDVLLRYLQVGKQVPMDARVVMLYGEPLNALEARLGGGMISSGADLQTKVERLARIEFGGHEIRLTSAELEEITWRARKQNKTVAQVVHDTWRKMQELFFTYAQQTR